MCFILLFLPCCGRLFSLEKPSMLGASGSVVVSSANLLNMQQLRAATIPPMVSPHSLYPHLAFRYAPLDRDRAQPPRHVSPASISTSADHSLWFASAAISKQISKCQLIFHTVKSWWVRICLVALGWSVVRFGGCLFWRFGVAVELI